MVFIHFIPPFFLCNVGVTTLRPIPSIPKDSHSDGLWDAAEHHSAVLAKDLKDFEPRKETQRLHQGRFNQRFEQPFNGGNI